MPNIVGVQFKKSGKVYYFDPKKIEFASGDGVIVETAHGLEFGTVAIPNTQLSDKDVKTDLKPVVRKATPKDIAQHKSILERCPQAIRETQERANKRGLDMKIVDAEFAFDNTKVVFYFTADNRIDFREFVKELASAYRMRIELRQIGIRDECKMKGGLGPCGRVCCCKSYMNDFARVSIKMAKTQGLSLNPVKISGLCGRLMCCLNYENDYYAQTAKFMPKVNAEIDTPYGRGKVFEADMLRHLVTVKITKGDGETELRTFTLDELGITPNYQDYCASCAQSEVDAAEDGEDTDVLQPDAEE